MKINQARHLLSAARRMRQTIAVADAIGAPDLKRCLVDARRIIRHELEIEVATQKGLQSLPNP